MRNLRNARALAFALLALLVFDVGCFWLPLYRGLLAPDSSTGSFERTLAATDRASRDPQRDVLVLGDSRIYDGLLVSIADGSASGLHFVNAAVSGSTPRVWDVFARALDPQGTRFRAVVIPVDTYADDDGAIGSEDNDDRLADLHYVALRASPSESARIARSFGPIDERIEAIADLALRAPLLRDDVQAFASDPLGRIERLREPLPDLTLERAQNSSLAGLHVDYPSQTLALPQPIAGEPLARLQRQIFHIAAPSAAYARYRREWLAPIVARYRARGVPVIFVRLPTRPLHAALPGPPSGTLLDFANADGAQLVPQDAYVALERPQNFYDAEHLDRAGATIFSKLLGSDVARAIRDPHFGNAPAPVVPPPSVAVPSARPAAANAAKAHPIATIAPVVATPFPLEIGPSPIARVTAALETVGTIAMLGRPIALVSYEFAIFLFAACMLALLLPNETSRRALLLLASWYFYARWNTLYLAILIALTTTDYVVARALENVRGARVRAILVVGVCANLGFLAIAKYADFASGTVAHLMGRADDPWALRLLVPVGISFHTFQSISYIVDVSRGKIRAERNYFNYALYIAFFPQLLAGPIVRAGRFFGELYARRAPSAEHAARGLAEIALGVLKKSAIADRFAPVVDAYYGAPAAYPGAPAAWCAALAFAVQIYFDFSGYTDIAIGCARLLGFDFPQNFHRPYLAWSVTEFWRRWHMTLSSWLRDYLYIPLGGNRGGRLATYRNLIVTMLLGGLWHGASWTFVIWGGYHGVLLAIERGLGIGRKREASALTGLRRVGATALTFGLVLVGWVFFRAPSPGVALDVLHRMIAGGAGPLGLDGGQFAIVAIALIVEIVLEARLLVGKRRFAFAFATLLALQLGTYPGLASPFVYFKF